MLKNAVASVSIPFFLLVAVPGTSDPGGQVPEPFSSGNLSGNRPAGWEPLTFPKIPQHTRYRLVKDNGIPVIQATSEASASGLIAKIRVDLKETPVLKWRWKIEHTLSKSDVRSKEGDDYPARVYVTFEYDPDKVGFSKKAKYRLGKLLFGEIPIAALNYIWENALPEGTIVESAYTEFSKMIVVVSGAKRVGEWVELERNVYADYRRAFGEEPPLVNGVAIMTDTDNTGERAVAYYGDLMFIRGEVREAAP
jgi:hypothetical protein